MLQKFFPIFVLLFFTINNSNSLTPCPVLSLVAYNPSKYPDLPSKKGFVAGRYFDGSTIYVGTGNAESCRSQPNMPARISTQPNIGKGAGAYMECSGEVFDDKTATYLGNHPNLHWVPANISTLSSILGAVVIKSGDFGFFVGRIHLKTTKGEEYQQVAKLHVNNGAHGLWYIKEDGSTASTDTDYEVLACNV